MKFLIGGDSWSQGEWDPYPIHSGVQQYLEELNHVVINVGLGGASNQTAITRIQHFIKSATDSYDFLVFFFTDPLRDATKQELNSKMPFDLIEKLSNESLAQLFEIQQSFRLKVILIGGYSSLEECNTSNLNYVIPSFSKLLVPEFKESKHSVSPGWKQLISLPVIGNVKQKEQYLQILLNGETKFKEYKNYPEYFYPDGAHPNRHSHRLLTDKILQMIT